MGGISEPMEGDGTGAAFGALSPDLHAALLGLIDEGAAVHVAVLDGDRRVVRANRAFVRAAGREVVGVDLSDLVAEGSRSGLRARLESAEATFFLLQLTPTNGEPCTLRAIVRRDAQGGRVLVAEPPVDDHRALEATLLSLNAELATLARESARQARALEAANEALRSAHWHLKKISEVLPICMSCREVKTGDGTWENVASFLMKNSDFLSHGYCARCAAHLIDEE